jgi:hypothetical protein
MLRQIFSALSQSLANRANDIVANVFEFSSKCVSSHDGAERLRGDWSQSGQIHIECFSC